jgi:RND family efflux transporter MFP subunit
MKNSRRILLPAAVLVIAGVLVSIAVASFGSPQLRPDDPRREPPLVAVTVAQPAAASERAFTGVVSARIQSNLGFRVPGKIVERLVDVGERVSTGQPLMRIDQNDLRLAVIAKENAAAAARAVAVQTRSDETRYNQLVVKGWATRQRYDQAKAALDSAEAQLAAAEAEATVAHNEAGYSLLAADADGTVVETLGEPGQVVAAGQIVIRLAHAGPREATVALPEAVRPSIGSSARATVYSNGSDRFPARLRQLSDSADPQSRTYEARYVLEGAAASAPLGATVTIWLTDADATQGSQIPVGAVLDDGQSTGVWIVDPAASKVSFREVKVRRLAQETATVTGVSPGEHVVALGVHLLHPGTTIRSLTARTTAQ